MKYNCNAADRLGAHQAPQSKCARPGGVRSARSHRTPMSFFRFHNPVASAQLPEINRHTMPSPVRPISLKTNDRHPNEVSHFFGPALLPCRAGFFILSAAEGQSRRKRSSQNITLLPFTQRNEGQAFAEAERRSESGFVQWDLAGGPAGRRTIDVSAEKEDSANRYAPWRDPSDVAAEAATYKTRNPSQFASEKLRIKCDTVALNSRRNAKKINDGHANKVRQIFVPLRARSEAVDTDTKATAAGLKTPALHLDLGKGKGARLKGGRYIGNGERPNEENGYRSEDRRYEGNGEGAQRRRPPDTFDSTTGGVSVREGGRYKCNVTKSRQRWRGFPASAWGASWRRGLSCAGGSISA